MTSPILVLELGCSVTSANKRRSRQPKPYIWCSGLYGWCACAGVSYCQGRHMYRCQVRSGSPHARTGAIALVVNCAHDGERTASCLPLRSERPGLHWSNRRRRLSGNYLLQALSLQPQPSVSSNGYQMHRVPQRVPQLMHVSHRQQSGRCMPVERSVAPI